MSEWQPIETAPKDGTFVLLCGGTGDYSSDRGWPFPPVVVAQWVNLPLHKHWRYASYDSGYYGEVENPTHWMPLPEPPRSLSQPLEDKTEEVIQPSSTLTEGERG